VTSVEDLRQGPDAETLARIAEKGGITQAVLEKLGCLRRWVEHSDTLEVTNGVNSCMGYPHHLHSWNSFSFVAKFIARF